MTYAADMGNPTTRAWLATVLFTGAGLLSLWLVAPWNEYLLPHVLFYAVLTLNSFFSIRLYASIQPKRIEQSALDTALVLVYLALAFSIGRPEFFALFALIVFITATPKYAYMLGHIPHGPLLRRKILIDISGIAFCAAVFAGTMAGMPLLFAWVLAIGFAVANIYHLIIHPMYRL